jgi:hypothetical protein
MNVFPRPVLVFARPTVSFGDVAFYKLEAGRAEVASFAAGTGLHGKMRVWCGPVRE